MTRSVPLVSRSISRRSRCHERSSGTCIPTLAGSILLVLVTGCGSSQHPSNEPNGAGSGASGSGGTASTSDGGTGGADRPPLHVVTACTGGQSGQLKVGQWEEVTPAQVLNLNSYSKSQAVLVDPNNPATVYVGWDGGGIYKSLDCGSTWIKINTGRNGEKLDPGRPWSMVIDPIESQTIYSVDGYGTNGLWKTTNGGVDWDMLFLPGTDVQKYVPDTFASIVSMDPTNRMHLVVSFHIGCTGPYSSGCQAESVDGGANWRLTTAPAGVEGAGPIVLNKTSWLTASPFGGLWLTTDNGATWRDVTPTGGGGGHYLPYRAKDGMMYLGTLQGVARSQDGTSWTLIPDSGGGLAGIVGTGKIMYASQQNGGLYYSASEDDPTKWAQIETPGMPKLDVGAYYFAYDPDHKIVYASAQMSGLWRIVTE